MLYIHIRAWSGFKKDSILIRTSGIQYHYSAFLLCSCNIFEILKLSKTGSHLNEQKLHGVHKEHTACTLCYTIHVIHPTLPLRSTTHHDILINLAKMTQMLTLLQKQKIVEAYNRGTEFKEIVSQPALLEWVKENPRLRDFRINRL